MVSANTNNNASLCMAEANVDVLQSLLTSLMTVDDPRKPKGKRYFMLDVLTVAVLGCMCGCDDAEALQDWGRKERDWLSGFLSFPHGPPTQDVFLRVLAARDPEQFRRAFVLCWASRVRSPWMVIRTEVVATGGRIAV